MNSISIPSIEFLPVPQKQVQSHSKVVKPLEINTGRKSTRYHSSTNFENFNKNKVNSSDEDSSVSSSTSSEQIHISSAELSYSDQNSNLKAIPRKKNSTHHIIQSKSLNYVHYPTIVSQNSSSQEQLNDDHFNLIREKKHMSSLLFHFIKNGEVFLNAKKEKHEKETTYFIFENQISFTPFCYLKSYQHGSRFSLIEGSKQLLGIAYIQEAGSSTKARQLRIVFGNQNIQTQDLSLIALKPSISDQSEYTFFETSLPFQQQPNGSCYLWFGNYSVIPSVKNYMIHDSTRKKILFEIYKTSSQTFSVHVEPPFSPLFGMVIGIAALVGNPKL